MPRLLRIAEVLELTGISKPTLYRRLRDGSFPQPVQMGPRTIRFRELDIQTWMAGLPSRAEFQEAHIAS